MIIVLVGVGGFIGIGALVVLGSMLMTSNTKHCCEHKHDDPKF